MAITAALVKELRERTGAGMMECKKALVEADGNIETAIDNMRKSGQAKAAKKAGRIAAEGVILAKSGDNTGVLVEVNSETDFVARDDNFKKFSSEVVDVALSNGTAEVEALNAAAMPSGESVEEARANLVAKIGENITVRRMVGDIGVERTWPMNSPLIAKFEVVRRGDARRAKLYYLRKLRGKKARLRQSQKTSGDIKGINVLPEG